MTSNLSLTGILMLFVLMALAACGGGGGETPPPVTPPPVTPPGMCTDTGTGQLRAIVKPTASQLVINEWMPDPTLVVDTAGEWFELRASAAFDLNGLQAGTTTLGAAPTGPGRRQLRADRGRRLRPVCPHLDGGNQRHAASGRRHLRLQPGAVERNPADWYRRHRARHQNLDHHRGRALSHDRHRRHPVRRTGCGGAVQRHRFRHPPCRQHAAGVSVIVGRTEPGPLMATIVRGREGTDVDAPSD